MRLLVNFIVYGTSVPVCSDNTPGKDLHPGAVMLVSMDDGHMFYLFTLPVHEPLAATYLALDHLTSPSVIGVCPHPPCRFWLQTVGSSGC